MTLPPSLGRPKHRTGHPLGHDHLDMPVTHHLRHGPGRRRRWLETLREGLKLAVRSAAL